MKKGILMAPNNPWMPQPYAQTPSSVWVGNNYSSGYSPNRSMANQPYNYSQPEPAPQTLNNVLQVMGPDSAEAFRLGPNSHVLLTDTTRPVIYVKTSDDSGYSQTRAFQLTEIPLHPVVQTEAKVENAPEPTLYLTREEFLDFVRDFNEFKKSVEEVVTSNG